MRSVVEIGTSKIICIIDGRKDKNTEMPGISLVRYSGIKNGGWADIREAADAIREAIEQAEAKQKKQIRIADVSVPGVFTKIALGYGKRQMQSYRVSPEEIDGIVEASVPRLAKTWTLVDVAAAYFTDDKGETYFDKPVNVRTSYLEACVSYMFASSAYIRDIQSVFDGLHIDIGRLIFENYAQALYLIPQEARDGCAVMIDVGHYDTNVSVIFGDAILAHDVFHYGGVTITESLCRSLTVDEGTAESLKKNYIFGIGVDRESFFYGKSPQGKMMSFDGVAVKRVIEGSVRRICEDLEIVLRSYGNFITRATPLFITGFGLRIRGVENFMKSIMNRTIYVLADSNQPLISPLYNSAAALLDNTSESVYDIGRNAQADGVFSRFVSKLKK